MKLHSALKGKPLKFIPEKRMLCIYGDKGITGSLEKMASPVLVRLSWQSSKICKMKYQSQKLEKGLKKERD